jgi:hypothetical protein
MLAFKKVSSSRFALAAGLMLVIGVLALAGGSWVQGAEAGTIPSVPTLPTLPSVPTVPTFNDVPTTHGFFAEIEAINHAGITQGCSASPPLYCPDDPTTRAQMAGFIERGVNAPGFDPGTGTGLFADVDSATWGTFAGWIELFYNEGITSGCATGPLRYCPSAPTLRNQMAVFLVRAIHGSSFVPPAATGIFGDVPLDGFFDRYIEQLYNDGVTLGCSATPLLFCPDDVVSRGQMAAFLARAFGIVP